MTADANARGNTVVIRNALPETLTLLIEPEGTPIPLGRGQAVKLSDPGGRPTEFELSRGPTGELDLQVWPAGRVRVRRDGGEVILT